MCFVWIAIILILIALIIYFTIKAKNDKPLFRVEEGNKKSKYWNYVIGCAIALAIVIVLFIIVKAKDIGKMFNKNQQLPQVMPEYKQIIRRASVDKSKYPY